MAVNKSKNVRIILSRRNALMAEHRNLMPGEGRNFKGPQCSVVSIVAFISWKRMHFARCYLAGNESCCTSHHDGTHFNLSAFHKVFKLPLQGILRTYM